MQTSGEVFQNLVFHQKQPFRGAQNTQPNVCTKSGRPSPGPSGQVFPMSTKERKTAWLCLGRPDKGFSNWAGEGRVGKADANSLGCFLQTVVETLGLSCELGEEPHREFPNNNNNSSRLLGMMC